MTHRNNTITAHAMCSVLKLFACLGLAAVQGAELSSPLVISSGLEMASNWAITLTVEQHRHANDQVAFNTRSYCYRSQCSYPGPTISLIPGDNFTLTLENKLGPYLHGDDHIMNTMHSPNTTNLHTHGLHISPLVDDVFVEAGPGESLHYPYEVPPDHAPGTHWYHAHYHGSSTYQIMGGLVGALIVEPLPSQNIPASITDADQYIMVLTHLKFDQEVSTRTGEINQGCGRDFYCDPVVEAPLCTGEETEASPYESFRIYSYLELGVDSGNDMEINEQFVDPSIQDMILVNGQFIPTVKLVVGSAAVFRMVSATGGGMLVLHLQEPLACSISIIAYDGVYMKTALRKETIALVEGSRADVQIMCHRAGMFSLYNRNKTEVLVVEVHPFGETKPKVTDEELAAIVQPSYLDDLMEDVEIDSYYSVHTWRNGLNHSICGHWLGAGYNCSALEPTGPEIPNATSVECPFSQFSGSRGLNPANYTAAHKLVTPVNAINEWTIYGMGNDQHPIHVHVHHMQVISFVGDDSANALGHEEFYLPGQWRDTLPAFQGVLTVRFKAADFEGETVVHW